MSHTPLDWMQRCGRLGETRSDCVRIPTEHQLWDCKWPLNLEPWISVLEVRTGRVVVVFCFGRQILRYSGLSVLQRAGCPTTERHKIDFDTPRHHGGSAQFRKDLVLFFRRVRDVAQLWKLYGIAPFEKVPLGGPWS